jgi:hypothetical protein
VVITIDPCGEHQSSAIPEINASSTFPLAIFREDNFSGRAAVSGMALLAFEAVTDASGW